MTADRDQREVRHIRDLEIVVANGFLQTQVECRLLRLLWMGVACGC
jgi:hypothetical protein